MNLEHQNINCISCLNYENCKKLENKYFDDLMENGGNWRSLFDDGNRVNSPPRRCTNAIVKKHLDKFNNSHVLEIGCGPLSEIDLNFCRENNLGTKKFDSDFYSGPFIDASEKNNVEIKVVNRAKKLYPRNNYGNRIHGSFILGIDFINNDSDNDNNEND